MLELSLIHQARCLQGNTDSITTCKINRPRYERLTDAEEIKVHLDVFRVSREEDAPGFPRVPESSWTQAQQMAVAV